MSGAQLLKERKYQIVAILGMAMVWPSIHNQLLYPVSFSFPKEAIDNPYSYYLTYCLIILLVTLAISFLFKGKVASTIFTSKSMITGIGILGSVGIMSLVFCDFSNGAAFACMGIGIVLSAIYVPIYFIFWSSRIVYASEKRAAFDLIMSYLLFAAITLMRLLLKLHAWPFAISYPLISALLAVFAFKGIPQKSYALNRSSLKTLPLFLLIPMTIFVYIATLVRCLLNPVNASYNYPPDQRIFIYITVGLLSVILAFLYRPHSRVRRYAHQPAFALSVIILIGGILLSGIGYLDGNLGNLPTIAGINVQELIIWAFVVANAQVKHVSVLRPAGFFLIFVVGASHITTVLFIMSANAFHIDAQELPIIAITIAAAFVILLLLNAVLTTMLYRAQMSSSHAPYGLNTKEKLSAISKSNTLTNDDKSPMSSDSSNVLVDEDTKDRTSSTHEPLKDIPACLLIASDEAAIDNIKSTFHLSNREVDTMRLAYRNMPTKEIAERLYVAESTVNSHLKGIYRKCDVHSRKELIALINRYKKESGI